MTLGIWTPQVWIPQTPTWTQIKNGSKIGPMPRFSNLVLQYLFSSLGSKGYLDSDVYYEWT